LYIFSFDIAIGWAQYGPHARKAEGKEETPSGEEHGTARLGKGCLEAFMRTQPQSRQPFLSNHIFDIFPN